MMRNVEDLTLGEIDKLIKCREDSGRYVCSESCVFFYYDDEGRTCCHKQAFYYNTKRLCGAKGILFVDPNTNKWQIDIDEASRINPIEVPGNLKHNYTVFECRKCGHQLYVSETPNFLDKLYDVASMDCQQCGESGYDNWVLSGKAYEFEGTIFKKRPGVN